ncbi:MAG: MmcQ/YjbR family DNA-binding protein [Chloroflexota bacterium]|nr:MmcQ/YjbR family DNA-binding protein [Chloroflexota bacterium]
MADADDVRQIALSLPETLQRPNDSRYFVGEKAFAWTWLERVDPKRARVAQPDVLVVRVADQLEKEALLAVDADKFFTEPHYDGYAAVLVRLPAVDVDELADLLAAAWRAVAPRRLVAELEG